MKKCEYCDKEIDEFKEICEDCDRIKEIARDTFYEIESKRIDERYDD